MTKIALLFFVDTKATILLLLCAFSIYNVGMA